MISSAEGGARAAISKRNKKDRPREERRAPGVSRREFNSSLNRRQQAVAAAVATTTRLGGVDSGAGQRAL